MHQNAHLLQTFYHFIRQIELYGAENLDPVKQEVMDDCETCLRADHDELQLATLQFCFPSHMRVHAEQSIQLLWHIQPKLTAPALMLLWEFDKSTTVFTLN